MIVPELFGDDEALVSQANAATQFSLRATLLAGPPLAGVLIAVIGATGVLLVDAATYVVSVLLVRAFVPEGQCAAAAGDRGLRAGVRFLVRDPLLRVWNVSFALGDAA